MIRDIRNIESQGIAALGVLAKNLPLAIKKLYTYGILS
jgi:hypothetical protein